MGRAEFGVTRIVVILTIMTCIVGADGPALLSLQERGANHLREPQSIFAATRSPDTDLKTAVDHEAEAGRVIWPLWTQCGEFHITKVTFGPFEGRESGRPRGSRGEAGGTRGSRSFVTRSSLSGTFITQVKGARLVAYREPLTEADRLNGLEWHGVVRLTALAYRVHETRSGKAPQWSPWKNGAPILLLGEGYAASYDRQLERRQGKWQVSLTRSHTAGTPIDVAKNTQAIICTELPH
jgi:hypothetical protein